MNNEPGKMDFEAYTAREIERLETVLDGLQELFKAQADPRVSEAILKTQNKLDAYRGVDASQIPAGTLSERSLRALKNL